MNLLLYHFPWSRYAKRLISKIENPRNAGIFTEEDAKERGMFLALGKEGSIHEGNVIHFFLLVDPLDGMIVDARFQLFGQSALIGAAEAAVELMVGKNYDQASRLTAQHIEKHLADKGKEEAFPWETAPHLNLVLGAMEEALNRCEGIPLPASYVAPPAELKLEGEGGSYPGFEELTKEQKILVIEQFLDKEVRPYIALDAGGVEINALEGLQLHIAYQGSCTSCISSVGATLSYIQSSLRHHIHPGLTVIPDL